LLALLVNVREGAVSFGAWLGIGIDRLSEERWSALDIIINSGTGRF
jgi:hypothetical protein